MPDRRLSSTRPKFPLRRTVGALGAVALALVATYGGFFAVCWLMLATGLAA